MAKAVLKNDKYRKVRGGYSRLFDVSCSKCNTHLFYYQKDGPGIIKRMYLDRIFGSKLYSGFAHVNLKQVPQLKCSSCKQVIGVPINYLKENRLAYRVFVGSIHKKVASTHGIKI